MTTNSLPPRLEGSRKGVLQFGIDTIHFYPVVDRLKVFVSVTWWGQTDKESVRFSPRIENRKTSNFGGLHLVQYDVVTTDKYFREYLRDASKLMLVVQSEEGSTIGFAVLENLERILDRRTFDENLEVFDDNGKVIGDLHYSFNYAVDHEHDQMKSKSSNVRSSSAPISEQPIVFSNTKSDDHLTRRQHPRISNTPLPGMVKANYDVQDASRTHFKIPAKIVKSKTNPSRPPPSPQGRKKPVVILKSKTAQRKQSPPNRPLFRPHQKVGPAATPKPKGFVTKSSQVTKPEKPTSKAKVTFSDENEVFCDDWTLPASVIDDDLDETGHSLRRILLRSKGRTEENRVADKDSKRTDDIDSKEDDIDSKDAFFDKRLELSASDEDPDYETIQKTPSEFSYDDVPSSSSSSNKTPKVIIADKENLAPKQPTTSSYPLPLWNITTERLKFLSEVKQLCTSIRSFTVTPALINKILDLGKRPKFSLQTRRSNESLGSSVSSNGGPTTFFLKYSIPPTKLPVNLCSRKLRGDEVTLNQKSLHPVTFTPDLLDAWWTADVHFKVFSRNLNQRVPLLIGEATLGLKYLLMHSKYSSGSEMGLPIYAAQSLTRDLGEADSFLQSEIIGDLKVAFLLCKRPSIPVQSSRPISPQKATREKEYEMPRKGTRDTNTSLNKRNPIREIEVNPKRKEDSTALHKRSGLWCPLFCLFRIDEGRNFVLDHDSPLSLYLKTRLLSNSDQVTSEVCWNTTRPSFRVQHMIPIQVDDQFLERCRDNHIVIEIWNFAQTDKLVGITTVPLHQLFLAFKDANRLDLVMSLDLPVIAVNDWLPVRDILSGNESGQLRVVLAAGTESQIHRLTNVMGFKTIRAKDESDMTGYDSVEDDELISSEEESVDVRTMDGRRSTDGRLSTDEEPVRDDDECERPKEVSSSLDEFNGEDTRATEGPRVPMPKSPTIPLENLTIPPRESPRVPLGRSPTEPLGRSPTEPLGRSPTVPLGRSPTVPLSTTPKETPLPSFMTSLGNSAASRHTHFRVKVFIDEARSLPKVYSGCDRTRKEPNSYATFTGASPHEIHMSKVVFGSSNPSWQFEKECRLPVEIFCDPRRHFIVKIWNNPRSKDEERDPETDHVIGFVAVDLSPLKAGFPVISGWYNIMDFVGRCRGQLKITVEPLDDIRSLDRIESNSSRESFDGGSSGGFSVSANYASFPSHVVQYSEQLITAVPNKSTDQCDAAGRPTTTDKVVTAERRPIIVSSSPTTTDKVDTAAAGRRPVLVSSATTAVIPSARKPSEQEKKLEVAPSVCHWKPPQVNVCEDPSRSFLNQKLADLDLLSANLRGKLRPDERKTEEPKKGLVRSETFVVKPSANVSRTAEQTTTSMSQLTLSQLQGCLQQNLMQIRTGLTGGDDQQSSEVRFSNSSSSLPSPIDPIDSITSVSTPDRGINTSLLLMTDLAANVLEQNRSLQDLGQIDWSAVLEPNRSRFSPEGTEERISSVNASVAGKK